MSLIVVYQTDQARNHKNAPHQQRKNPNGLCIAMRKCSGIDYEKQADD
ncbi:hypothetical protein [Ectopseudomonas mendocina]|nr:MULTISPECIES: hypothetical protein [Pseudomonas aeruginosa group]